MLSEYIAAGLDPETFWRITPRELVAHFAGAVRRAKAGQKRLGWAVHQNAALTRVDKFPRFDDFMGEKKPKPDTMTMLRALAAQLPKERLS